MLHSYLSLASMFIPTASFLLCATVTAHNSHYPCTACLNPLMQLDFVVAGLFLNLLTHRCFKFPATQLRYSLALTSLCQCHRCENSEKPTTRMLSIQQRVCAQKSLRGERAAAQLCMTTHGVEAPAYRYKRNIHKTTLR